MWRVGGGVSGAGNVRGKKGCETVERMEQELETEGGIF